MKVLGRKLTANTVCTLIPILFLTIFYILPMLIVVVYSFWSIDDAGMLYPAWNFDQYAMVFSNPVYFSLLTKSLGIALVNMLACLLISYPITYFIAKIAKPKWRYPLLFLIILPNFLCAYSL